MSTPTGPERAGRGEGDGPLDDLDARILERLDGLHEQLDGPPPGFSDLMVFAVAAHGLDLDLARLEQGALTARADEEETRSLTFEADSLSVLLRVTGAGDDRVRLDGWLAPAEPAMVELRHPGSAPDRSLTAGDDGRFVVEGLRRGLVQLVVRRGPGAAAVVTPTFEL